MAALSTSDDANVYLNYKCASQSVIINQTLVISYVNCAIMQNIQSAFYTCEQQMREKKFLFPQIHRKQQPLKFKKVILRHRLILNVFTQVG